MEALTGQQVANRARPRIFLSQQALFPDQYAWFVLLSTLDILLTVLAIQAGAREANLLAAWMLGRFGAAGLIMLKFPAVVIVVALCQVVGFQKPQTGRRLAEWVVAIAAIPVVIGAVIVLFTHLRVF